MNKREDGRKLIEALVEDFKQNYDEYTSTISKYNELQLRNDFLNPFLIAFGWDITNTKHLPQYLREVVLENAIKQPKDDNTKKKPDYTLRLGGIRKFFVEAKKPSVNIDNDKKSAFQTRHYGWNASMPMSILTNFDKLAIYDCKTPPNPDNPASIARIKIYNFNDYVSKFDEIYDQISYEAVYSGTFDQLFVKAEVKTGEYPFDQHFLDQIANWRKILAQNIIENNKIQDIHELNFLIQQLINRIVFLRICEDRELEKYEKLKNIKSYEELKELFVKADSRYNSGLFDFIDDELSFSTKIDNKLLINIFQELYYPESPYDFSIVETSVLGEIYELFLAKEIRIDDGNIDIIDKPEIIESRGVIKTPNYIAQEIAIKTLSKLFKDKNPDKISKLKIADISCGSGIFLLAAYEYLLNYHIEWYSNDGIEKHKDKIYAGHNGVKYLTLHEKQRILLNNIYGVDIDEQAVEVARFSLLLKVLENETNESIDNHMNKYKERALPKLKNNIKCGNSLVDNNYYKFDKSGTISSEKGYNINIFDWKQEFSNIKFDAIIGNPPYVRIQNMVKYSPCEVGYYKSKFSPYKCSKNDNYDKYYLFIERALSLVNDKGYVGYIVPHKFFVTKFGECLRKLISIDKHVSEIIHFGVQQVFEKRLTYTCILVMNKFESNKFIVEHVLNLDAWRNGEQADIQSYDATHITDKPWVFVNPKMSNLFNRIAQENELRLSDVADIFVGLQTSKDPIYIIKPIKETDKYVTFIDITENPISIEKSILKPFLLDVKLNSFEKPSPNTYIIYPYKIIDSKAKLLSQKEMEEHFPKCWEYLNKHKDILLDRSISGFTEETWYKYGRSQSLLKFNGESKLIWPVLSTEPRYAYDDNNIFISGGGNGPYYALRPKPESNLSIFYIQAILCHDFFDYWVLSRCSKFEGDYGSHGKQFIVDIPIKNINFNNSNDVDLYNSIIESVQLLIKITEDFKKCKIPQKKDLNARNCAIIKNRINTLVEQIYGISRQDMELIKEIQKSAEKE